MYDFNTCTGALAYPAEWLYVSSDDDWADGKKVKSVAKLCGGIALDSLNILAYTYGATVLGLAVYYTLKSKFV